ncbi:MAG: MFS transporter [Pseudomonadales bacterium]|nr:MFS transporter [Pseudomonadales bacterium]
MSNNTVLPASSYRWLIVGLTVINQAVSVGILIYTFALFVVPWLGEFNVSRGQTMFAIFFLQITVGLISPYLGRLLDKHSMRLMVLIGALSVSTGLLLLSQVTAFWQVVVVYATFLPLGMVLCGSLASQTMVSKWFTSNRSMALGFSSTGTSLGGFVFPLLVAGLMAEYTWQDTYLILAVLALLLLIPLNFFMLKRTPDDPDDSAQTVKSIDQKVWTTREILSSKMFWIPIAALVPVNAAFGGVQFHLGAYLNDLGFESGGAAQLIAITSVSMIAGKFLFGGLGDRVDHRKLCWLMGVFLGAALLLYMGQPIWVSLMLAAVFQGLATGGIMPMMGIIYASRFGTLSFGRVLGLVNMFLMTGSFGSLFSGWVFDFTLSYDYAFVSFLLLLVPSAIAIRWLPQPPAD